MEPKNGLCVALEKHTRLDSAGCLFFEFALNFLLDVVEARARGRVSQLFVSFCSSTVFFFSDDPAFARHLTDEIRLLAVCCCFNGSTFVSIRVSDLSSHCAAPSGKLLPCFRLTLFRRNWSAHGFVLHSLQSISAKCQLPSPVAGPLHYLDSA